MGARYTREHAVSPDIMGYSMAGTVDTVGAGVSHLAPWRPRRLPGPPRRVHRPARHRRRIPRAQARVVALPEDVDFDRAPYYPLAVGAVTWVEIGESGPTDTVVILGQGLVGSLMLQVMKAAGRGYVIAVDALDRRCELAAELGADRVVNAGEGGPGGGGAPADQRRRRHTS